jgi:SAM-dependent methyltransferase
MGNPLVRVAGKLTDAGDRRIVACSVGRAAPVSAKPRLLDLFCGAGGATKGYQRAGFYVVGVDINRQPHYCGDEFVQGDAMTYPLEGFDAIHASPPCQAYSTATRDQSLHPDLIERYAPSSTEVTTIQVALANLAQWVRTDGKFPKIVPQNDAEVGAEIVRRQKLCAALDRAAMNTGSDITYKLRPLCSHPKDKMGGYRDAQCSNCGADLGTNDDDDD